MGNEPKEVPVPVEEMVNEKKSEAVRKIADRIKNLKEEASKSAMLATTALLEIGTSAVIFGSSVHNSNEVAAVVGGGLMAFGVVIGSIGFHRRSVEQGEANALTTVLATHLLSSVEPDQNSASGSSAS